MAPSEEKNQRWSPWHTKLHKELLANPDLLPTNASLLVAVSGGQDSMALIGLLLDLKRIHHWNLKVWHGDHGWHKDSKKIANELKNWCQSQELNFCFDRADDKQASSEASAREWRLEKLACRAKLLSSVLKENPCTHILTAHTGSDRTETLLINLARGTNLAGLSSMRIRRKLNELSPQNIQLVKPMLSFSRKETAKICSELNLPIWLDPSNKSQKFSRNRIRHEVLPVLEELYPGCSKRIAGLAERLTKFEDDRSTLTKLGLSAIETCEGLARKKLYGISLTACSTLLAAWLKQSGTPSLNAKQLNNISRYIIEKTHNGSQDISKGWKIIWNKELIKLEKTK